MPWTRHGRTTSFLTLTSSTSRHSLYVRDSCVAFWNSHRLFMACCRNSEYAPWWMSKKPRRLGSMCCNDGAFYVLNISLWVFIDHVACAILKRRRSVDKHVSSSRSECQMQIRDRSEQWGGVRESSLTMCVVHGQVFFRELRIHAEAGGVDPERQWFRWVFNSWETFAKV